MKSIILLAFFSLLSCSEKDKSKEIQTKIVGIIPYDEVSKLEVEKISKTIEEFYKIKTQILPSDVLPQQAFVNIKLPRYKADSIIRIQNRKKVDSLDFIMGLTTKDISVTKKDKDGNILKPTWKYNDFGIMGLAYRPGTSSIISKFRLKNNNKSLELERFKKVVIHEFGHNLGLPHCPNKHCVMTSAAEKISTIDNEKMELCEECTLKIK
ncbi:archaemetzincin [Flavobacterium sp.]|uniref:archaemetzincin n=1 Tax=Flavobacterium sp. TaxID=239 RepID=UPI00261C53BA|nr:archaemetzincin [Flavobacterium sp.]